MPSPLSGMPRLSSAATPGSESAAEHQGMNQARAVDRVFAVIARVVMAAGNINGALPHEREQLCRRAGELRRGLRRIVRIG